MDPFLLIVLLGSSGWLLGYLIYRKLMHGTFWGKWEPLDDRWFTYEEWRDFMNASKAREQKRVASLPKSQDLTKQEPAPQEPALTLYDHLLDD